VQVYTVKIERLRASRHCPSYSIKRYQSHRNCGAIASNSFSAKNLFGEKSNKSFVTIVKVKSLGK